METIPATYPLSYWEREAFFKDIDVAVIGAGIVGLSAALSLRERQPKLRVAVLERGALPAGASTRNAGFACFGSMTELLDDLSVQPEDEVWGLVEKRWRGLQRLRQRLGDQALRYQEWGGYELFRPEDRQAYEACLDHLTAFNRRLARMTGHTETYRRVDDRMHIFGFKGVDHLIVNRAEGQLHTGWMMRSLLDCVRQAGIPVFHGIGIEALEPATECVQLLTSQGWPLTAGRVIVATNGFARRLLPELVLEPARNQVLVTRPVPDLRVKGCFHYDRGYFYFRNIDGRILLGGGRHLDRMTEQTSELGHTSLIQNALLELLRQVILPGQPVEVEQWWSGIMGVGNDKKPIVREVKPNIAVAVKLGGMGVALGSLIGEEVAGVVV